MLGAPDEVAAQARHLGLRLPEDVGILDPRTVAERYVGPLAELRRAKGWTEEVAREHLADPIMAVSYTHLTLPTNREV